MKRSFKRSRILALVAAAAVGFLFTATGATKSEAQVRFSLNIGAAPVCPYGYYDVAPYACAPYGYYGPEWFTGGVFIGAGPWYHGPARFYGRVDNRFSRDRGYRGPTPRAGERPDPRNRLDRVSHFKGNERRDGRGHARGH